jgi:3'-phosphoadenosine 5'-phosphosulfate sulfotransferase (PAPS reductase)/FAD synthetase
VTTSLAKLSARADELAVSASSVLSSAVRIHKPSAIFALFSGGHDSLCATAVAAIHSRFTAAVHINTTIGIEETRTFVRDTCRKNKWPLLEYPPPVTYRRLVLSDG